MKKDEFYEKWQELDEPSMYGCYIDVDFYENKNDTILVDGHINIDQVRLLLEYMSSI
jgi:hypothetical protein